MDRSHEVHSTVYNRSLVNYFQAEFERSELVSPIMNDLIRGRDRRSARTPTRGRSETRRSLPTP